MKYIKAYIIIPILLVGYLSYSQVDTGYNSIDTLSIAYYDVFDDADPILPEDPLILHIEMDLKEFYKSKYRDESVRANLSVLLKDSILVTKKIKIKPRGEFRKNWCTFPPVELNFAKSDTDQIFTQETDKLKLVTHCRNSKLYEQYVLKEYLCYKMYNLLTDYSFRVRLLEIHYIDNKGKKKPITKYGFIIESNKSLANRLEAYPIKLKGIQLNQTDNDVVHIMTLYQFMIGNPDWAISVLHNIKLYKPKDPSKFYPIPVPYDFDYCGMVNTHYATPDERLGIKSVRERIYRGFCIPEKEMMENIETFIQSKESFYTLVNNFDLLDKYSKAEMVEYLDEFYEIIEKPYNIEREILQNCKKL